MGYINHSQMVTVGLLLGSLHYINKFPWKWITIKIFDICEDYSYIHYILRLVFPDVWYHLIPHYIILYSHIVGCISMIFPYMAVCQNLVPLVNIKIAGEWMFIPLELIIIGFDPYPHVDFDVKVPSQRGAPWPFQTAKCLGNSGETLVRVQICNLSCKCRAVTRKPRLAPSHNRSVS